LTTINHHTLSDFRMERGEELDELFAQLLVVMEQGGWVKLEEVMHDGSKVRTQAGADSFRGLATVEKKLAAAREVTQEDPQGRGNRRREAAQQRVRREREERLGRALQELQKIQQGREQESEKAAVRVSVSEPEARWMQHGDKAKAPSYNAQVSTDGAEGVIVGADLSQSSDDSAGLIPAMDEVKRNLGRDARVAVADGGFTNLATIEKMAERKIDFVGSLPDPRERSEAAMKSVGIDPQFAPHFFIFQETSQTLQCPAGKTLRYRRQSRKGKKWYRQYQAAGSDCSGCAYQKRCCPRRPERGRTVSRLEQEPESLRRFREKMAGAEAQRIYRRRGAVAEFPFAWLKEKFGLRKFRLFGRSKARTELVWACLAHNAMIWKRLAWQPLRTVVVAA
jgi:DDE family transposase